MKSLKENPDCARMIGPVVPGTIVPNGFKLPGTNFQLDPIKGAFDLGAMIRYLDISDAYPGAEWGHPSGRSRSESRYVRRGELIAELYLR